MPETPREDTTISMSTRYDRANARFQVAIEIGDDDIQLLDRPRALRWAEEVMSAVACCEHDAAVAAQLRDLATDAQDSARLIHRLRITRKEPKHALANLVLLPGVSAFTGKAFLTLLHRGQSLGQWSPADARKHAAYVLEVVRGADLDTEYLKLLRDDVGLPEAHCLGIIHELFNYLDKERDEDDHG